MPEQLYELNRFCPDSSCTGIAEPEEDPQGGGSGILRYWVCSVCEMEFGHQLVPRDQPESVCSLGIPASVREKFTPRPVDQRKAVFLGAIGRRPE